MRDLIITTIRNSLKWNACIDGGMEEELPLLENASDEDLLEYYDYYAGGI